MIRKDVTRSPRETCYFCGSEGPIETHHVVPQRFGGDGSENNLVDLCPTCHERLERLYDDETWAEVRLYDPESESVEVEMSISEIESLVAHVTHELNNEYGYPPTGQQIADALRRVGIGEGDAEYYVRKGASTAAISKLEPDDNVLDTKFAAGRGLDEYEPIANQLPTIEGVTEYCSSCNCEYIPVLVSEDADEECPYCGATIKEQRNAVTETSASDDNTSADGPTAELPDEVPKEQERIERLKQLVESVSRDHKEGAPIAEVIEEAMTVGYDRELVEKEIENLKTKGEVYEPKRHYLRVT